MSGDLVTVDGLLSALDSAVPKRLSEAAHHVLDFAGAAVDALFRAIARPENRNRRGSLLYALRAFHCEGRFSELFGLALHGNYEVQCHALSILQGQTFELTLEQTDEADRALSELGERENLSVEDVERLRGELRCVLSRLREP